MALIECPECKREISDKAVSCPHCGYQQQKTKKAPEKKKSSPNGCLVAILIIIVFAVISQLMPDDNSEPEKSTKAIDNHSPGLAYITIEKLVKRDLKSPKTAEFPSYKEKLKHTKYIGSNTYKINSYVDSQNSFGALVRTKFSCEVVFTGGDNIRMKNLQFY